MFNGQITTRGGEATSLQITHLEDIHPSDDAIEPGFPFLVKVRGDAVSEIYVLPIGQDEYVQTALSSGWNVEILKGIKYPSSITSALQIGY